MGEVEKIFNKFKFSNFQDLRPVFMDFLDSQKEHQVDAYTMEKKELDHIMTRLAFAMKHWGYSQPPSSEVKVPDSKPEQDDTPMEKAV